MLNSRPFRLAVWVLLLLLIALVGSRVPFLFRPLGMVIGAVFIPLFFAGLLYYWLSPVVNFLCRLRLPRSLAIAIVYGVIFGSIGVLIATAVPALQRQLVSIVNNAPRLVEALRTRLLALEENEWITFIAGENAVDLDGLVHHITVTFNSLLTSLGQNITPLIGLTTNFITLLFVIPFILFYLLLEGEKLTPLLVSNLLPSHLHREARRVLSEMDKALTNYIQGMAIICLSVGLLALIGFLIIGLEYALLLSVIIAITNIIPYIGPLVGMVPALLVGIVQSPSMAWWALLVVLIVQQIESVLISPRVMGKQLGSHPVVILLLVLIAGRLFGLRGVFFAIPLFAVLKAIFRPIYTLALLYLRPATNTSPPPPHPPKANPRRQG